VTTIYLIRHAYTGIKEHLQEPDTPLSKVGQIQAQKITNRLSPIKLGVIFCSEYRRTIETAEIIAKSHKTEIKMNSSLDEIGVWTSPTQLHSPTFSPRQYEEELGILHRAQEKAIDFLEEISHRYSGKKVVAVAHGNIIRGIIAEALKAGVETVVRLRVDLASLSILEHEEKGDFFRLTLFNDTSHL
jgi:broad specificity phosphatase PhoE